MAKPIRTKSVGCKIANKELEKTQLKMGKNYQLRKGKAIEYQTRRETQKQKINLKNQE